MLGTVAKRCFIVCINIRPHEWPFAIAMSAYFFLTVATFWILKPLKKGIFIGYYAANGVDLFGWHLAAAQAELLAKIANMAVAIVAVVVFSLLAGRLRRQQLTYVFAVFFMLASALYLPVLARPADATVWTFYLFGDLYSTLMIATFFAFLNDSVTPDQATRLYGVVGAGGVMGGVFGSTVVAASIQQVSMPAWLWIVIGAGALVMVAAYVAARTRPAQAVRPAAPVPVPAPRAGQPALEGAKLALRSPYLLSIVAIVGLYELASTVLDFMFTTTVTHYLSGDAIGQHFSLVFSITNWVSMLVQLILTSLIMRKLGMVVALLVLPAAMLLGASAFALLPGLWIGSLLNTADNGFSYSLNQSAKEALYVPTSSNEKYKAKAFIDMFVQRFAKAIAVVLSLGITTAFSDFSSLRWLAAVVGVIILGWFYAAFYAGRRFQARAAA